jgi:hypothetical protein
MTFKPQDQVNYQGYCYIVSRQEPDGRFFIYPRRRSTYAYHAVRVDAAKLSPWVQPVEDRSKAQTCQICGRAILASKGLIAHHGYQRPQGWHAQTASCYGARELPYERDCTVLQRYIAEVLVPHGERLGVYIAKLQHEAPEVPGPAEDVLDSRGEYVYRRGRKVTRNPLIGAEHPDYAHFRKLALANVEGELRQLNHELEHQRKRVADWKAPA